MTDGPILNTTLSSSVLVVDDEPANVVLVAGILHRHGFDNVKFTWHTP